MGIPTYNNVQVLTIPVKEIARRKQYLSLNLASVDTVKHELQNFVKEVCSNYAISMDDLIKVIHNSSGSFSDEVLEYLKGLSNKQIKNCIESFIYRIQSFGYGPSRVFCDGWKTLIRVEPHSKKEKNNAAPFMFKLLGLKIKKEYFFYNKDFVNPYTLDRKEIPQHLNTIWETDMDKKIYVEMLRKYNEEEKKQKPVVSKDELDVTEKTKLSFPMGQ